MSQPNDVATIDGVITGMYRGLSGGTPDQHELEACNDLFLPGATVVLTRHQPDGSMRTEPISGREWLRANRPEFGSRNLHETEVARITERFGNTASVRSAFDARLPGDGDPEPIQGINTFQLILLNGRWWIVGISRVLGSPVRHDITTGELCETHRS